MASRNANALLLAALPLALLVLLAGCAQPTQNETPYAPQPPQTPPTPGSPGGGSDQVVPVGATPSPTPQKITPETPIRPAGERDASSPAPQPSQAPSYSGKVLAGTKALVLDFKKSDYDAALAGDQVILLYFYANWCPICRDEVPRLYDAFNQLNSSGVVAFRVNYNDNETDDAEKALAKQFGITYQHTKVILENDAQALKSLESWDTQTYLEKVSEHL
ncbi:MAG TPA: redoxin domain-containing protein [archaeon]|nr:redoxin domain-containing protein [archaeon]